MIQDNFINGVELVTEENVIDYNKIYEDFEKSKCGKFLDKYVETHIPKNVEDITCEQMKNLTILETLLKLSYTYKDEFCGEDKDGSYHFPVTDKYWDFIRGLTNLDLDEDYEYGDLYTVMENLDLLLEDVLEIFRSFIKFVEDEK